MSPVGSHPEEGLTRTVESWVGVCLTRSLCARIHIWEPLTFFVTRKPEAAEMLACSTAVLLSVTAVACCEAAEVSHQSPRVTR